MNEEEVLSDAAFDELIAEAKRTFCWLDEFKLRFAAERKVRWQKLAGPLVDEMLANRESAERRLDDRDPKKRLTALMVLLEHWRPDVHLAQKCEQMAFADPDAQVRGVALSGLGRCHAQNRDARVLGLLANVVLDERQANDFRKSAYFGLFQVAGVDARSLSDPDFRFPEDVDWNLVSRCTAKAEIVKHPA